MKITEVKEVQDHFISLLWDDGHTGIIPRSDVSILSSGALVFSIICNHYSGPKLYQLAVLSTFEKYENYRSSTNVYAYLENFTMWRGYSWKK